MLWNIIFTLTALLMLGSAMAALFARQAMYGALYLVISMIAVAMLYFLLGAPFISALQVSLYVGAIAVLLVFMITMLNRTSPRRRARRKGVLLPLLLLALLLGEGVALFALRVQAPVQAVVSVGPKVVGGALFGHYLLLVEATALLLLAALTAVLHLSRKGEES
ncbi:NADH-quinone oxidoreductase subunit J [Acidihalobacter prosperus]